MVIGCSQVVDALGNMYLLNPFDCLDLDNQPLIYKEVCDILSNNFSSIQNIHRVLLCYMETRFTKLEYKGILVDLLKKPSTQRI